MRRAPVVRDSFRPDRRLGAGAVGDDDSSLPADDGSLRLARCIYVGIGILCRRRFTRSAHGSAFNRQSYVFGVGRRRQTGGMLRYRQIDVHRSWRR